MVIPDELLRCGVTRSFCALFAELTGSLSNGGDDEVLALPEPDEGITTWLLAVTARTFVTSDELEDAPVTKTIYNWTI